MANKTDIVTKQYLDEQLTEKFTALNKRFDELFQKLDWFTKKYTDLETEQTLQSGRLSDHNDRLEIVEDKLGIAAT